MMFITYVIGYFFIGSLYGGLLRISGEDDGDIIALAVLGWPLAVPIHLGFWLTSLLPKQEKK